MKNTCRYHYQNFNDMIYSSWDIQQNKLVILGHFFLFIPLKTQKLKFWKKKKFAGDIVTLHRCTKNRNNMMYGSWDTEGDRPNFLLFSAIFSPFTSLITQKIKICKNEKTPRDIITLHMFTINDNHMMYGSWDMEEDWQTFLSFGPFFALLSP